MNQEWCNEILENHIKSLDLVADHTKMKVQYIREYVKHWLRVGCNSDNFNTLNFIDCMCNAGVYADGTKGTPIEVLELFIDSAKEHKNKKFNLLLNDNNKERINIIKKIVNSYTVPDNVKCFYRDYDVNKFINCLIDDKMNEYFVFGKFSILFVDPYNFGTVKIKSLIDFLKKRRCELIFNYFISDYRRNHANVSQQHKKLEIKASLEGILDLDIENVDGDDLMTILHKNIKERTQIKYVFSYPFKITTNIELYYIIFATPNVEGLKKVKDSLWNVFKGKDCFRNPPKNKGYEQISFDLEDYDKNYNIITYSNEAKDILQNEFAGQTISFTKIEENVLEHTMLKSDQIIENVQNR